MRSRKGIGNLVFATVISLAVLGNSGEVTAAVIQPGQDAVGFSGTNFIDNQPVDLNEDLKKKVILLDFGSIYCSSCMVTVPNLIKLSKEYSEDDLAIYNIYLDVYNPQRVIKFFMGFARDLQFSLLIDEKLKISRAYGIDTLPTTILIDKSGKVQRVITGYTEADEKEINQLVERLISELPGGGVEAKKEEEGMNLFTPESFTKTTRDSIFIVGFIGGSGIKDVSLKLNNLPETLTQTKDNIFHINSKLSLAMNLIEIKSKIAEGREKSESVIIFREPTLGMGINSELPEFRFHLDDEKKPCIRCHKLTVALQDKETVQSTQICLACHKNLTKHIFVHGPISVGGCLPCHDYTSFPVKYELRKKGVSLCVECHEGIKEKIGRANVHGPVAAGVCSVCHDPHGSHERFFMKRKLDQTCISCHQDTLKDYAKEYVHSPVREGNCTGCHDPHSSDYKWFLKRDEFVLCVLCHEEGTYSHTHRVGVFPKKEVEPGAETLTLDTDGRVICVTCHFIHAGDYDKLVRGSTDGYCSRICH